MCSNPALDVSHETLWSPGLLGTWPVFISRTPSFPPCTHLVQCKPHEKGMLNTNEKMNKLHVLWCWWRMILSLIMRNLIALFVEHIVLILLKRVAWMNCYSLSQVSTVLWTCSQLSSTISSEVTSWWVEVEVEFLLKLPYYSEYHIIPIFEGLNFSFPSFRLEFMFQKWKQTLTLCCC